MFKEKLQELIEEKDITISKLAKDIGLAKSIVSDWNCGKVLPQLNNAILVANYFNYSLDYLFTDAVENNYKPFNIDINFGKRLKSMLKQLKIKQKDVVENLKISKSDIHYWTKTSAYPRMDTIIKIADYLQVSIDYLVGIE